MEKKYLPKSFEEDIITKNLENNIYSSKKSKKKPFCIIMPPPNVTGKLHMGHSLNCTIQDIIIRIQKFKSYETLLVPGLDHASIATELKIKEQLKEEGLTKEEIGRDNFLIRAKMWKEKYGSLIIDQMKSLGISADFNRLVYTMDEKRNNIVDKIFVDMYNSDFIFKDYRVNNFCTNCRSVISDSEIEFVETVGNVYYIKYYIKDSNDYIIVGTTRPETMLGDTALAINISDSRYESLKDKTFVVPLIGREINLVADKYIDSSFLSGIMKVTPAHDINDYKLSKIHNLKSYLVIDENSRVVNSGIYNGLTIKEARKKIIKDLEDGGYLDKVQDYKHNVPHCYRCNNVVQPLLSQQWFVKIKDIAEKTLNYIKKNKIEIIPKHFENLYFSWIDKIEDWCISRQLWWGHRLPVYYCNNCNNEFASTEKINCPKCNSVQIIQDENVLDTWYSSSLFAFSALDFLDNKEEFNYYFPSQILVTAYDILFFWVARMIFCTEINLKTIPFEKILIHGIVRDELGRKMSKSLGNGIDPLVIIDKYSVDILRLSLIHGHALGIDIRYSKDKPEQAKNYINKIYNACIYILNYKEKNKLESNFIDILLLKPSDKWILHKFNLLINTINNNIQNYDLGLYSVNLYEFFWWEFCDWYIEISKHVTNDFEYNNTYNVLYYIFTNFLKLVNPIIPLVTQYVYREFSNKEIYEETFPLFKEEYVFTKTYNEFENIKLLIKKIRNFRQEYNLIKTKLYINIKNNNINQTYINFIINLCNVENRNLENEEKVHTIISNDYKIFIWYEQIIDKEKELIRNEKIKSYILKSIIILAQRLENENFIKNANKEVVSGTKHKYEMLKNNLVEVEKNIQNLKN